MYFAICRGKNYEITSANSQNCLNFVISNDVVIGIASEHKSSVHSPKVIGVGNSYFCYYTGSDSCEKIFSKKYPSHEFGNGFFIFLAISTDGIHFVFNKKIDIPVTGNLINCYGHNPIVFGGKVLLFFTGFDGIVNRIYVSESEDGLHFGRSYCLITPDEGSNEIGCYSCSLLKLSENSFRIYYGVRFVDNHWEIHSSLLQINR